MSQPPWRQTGWRQVRWCWYTGVAYLHPLYYLCGVFFHMAEKGLGEHISLLTALVPIRWFGGSVIIVFYG